VYGRRPLTLKELEAALTTQLDFKSKVSTDEYRIDLTTEAVTSASGVILEIIDNDRVHLIQCWASDTQNPGTTWVPYLPRPVRYLPDLLQNSRYLPGRFYSGTQVPKHFDHVHYFSLYFIELKM
jgi:hypothetical protein